MFLLRLVLVFCAAAALAGGGGVHAAGPLQFPRRPAPHSERVDALHRDHQRAKRLLARASHLEAERVQAEQHRMRKELLERKDALSKTQARAEAAGADRVTMQTEVFLAEQAVYDAQGAVEAHSQKAAAAVTAADRARVAAGLETHEVASERWHEDGL